MVLSLASIPFIYKPIHSRVLGWRADSLYRDAQDFAAEEDWHEAHRTAKASLYLKPTIETLRLYVKAAQHTRDPHRLRVALYLFSFEGATSDDRRSVLRAFLDANDLVATSHLIRELKVEDYTPEIRLQIVRFLLKAGQLKEAGAVADLEAQEGRGGCDLIVAGELVATGETGFREEVSRRIQRVLGSAGDEEALRAVNLLATIPDHWVRRDLAQRVVDRFADAKGLSGADQLRVDLFRIALRSKPREWIISDRIEQHRESEPELLLNWLSRLGETARVVSMTDEMENLSVEIYKLRTSALFAIGRYDVLAKELENPPSQLSKVVVVAARAAVAARQGLNSRAVLLWNKAFELAERSTERNEYYELAVAAARAEDREREMQALSAALEHRMGLAPPMSKVKPVLQWLYDQGKGDRLGRICYRMLAREPGNPLLINIHHYLQLLKGESPDRSFDALQELVEAFPRELNFRSSLAFALLRADRPAEALAQMEQHQSEPAAFPDPEKAVYAAILSALGRKSEATRLNREIAWSKIPAFEEEAIRPYLF